MPTNNATKFIGCMTVSVCSMCKNAFESTIHIFFHCPLASNIWNWLIITLKAPINISSQDDLWSLCNKSNFPKGSLIIKAMIFSLAEIWQVRNVAQYHNKLIPIHNVITNIKTQIIMANNNSSLTSSASMTYFNLLKSFQVTIHPPEAPIIKEVIRQPPSTAWSKGNCDEVVASSSSGRGDIFRDSKGNFILGANPDC
ncbi:unnamed protein product [Lathyrus oleraceus]